MKDSAYFSVLTLCRKILDSHAVIDNSFPVICGIQAGVLTQAESALTAISIAQEKTINAGELHPLSTPQEIAHQESH